MDKEQYERNKEFAGEKKPSMKRRLVGHDYAERQMYMVTMVVEGRRPLFGSIVGRSDAPPDSEDAPRMELTELGRRVSDEWWGIPNYYPQIEIKALQMMPDHLHGIIFIREKMEKDLSRVIRGFKTGCNRAYRELFPSVQSVVTESQQTGRQPQQTGRQISQNGNTHGLLFELGFNDKLLQRKGQLQRWLDYLHDNPRRLLVKRERPDLLRPFLTCNWVLIFTTALATARYSLLHSAWRCACRVDLQASSWKPKWHGIWRLPKMVQFLSPLPSHLARNVSCAKLSTSTFPLSWCCATALRLYQSLMANSSMLVQRGTC